MSRLESILILILFVLPGAVSCSPTPATTQAPSEVPSLAPTATSTQAPTEIPTQAPVDPSSLKVFFFINGALDDKVYFDPIYLGILQAKEELGFECGFYEAGFDSGDTLPKLVVAAAEEQYDIMVLAGHDMGRALALIAPKHPNKKFILLDSVTGCFANVFSAALELEEASYVAGYYAGLMTGVSTLAGINPEQKVGVVGGMEMPMIAASLDAFKAGAVAAGIPPENVLSDYTGDFGDANKGRMAAQPMFTAGADIVFQVAGGAGRGVFEAARDAGCYAIGINFDQAVHFEQNNPDLARVILTSVVKDYQAAAYRAVSMAVKGELPYGQAALWGLSEGAAGLVKNKYYDQYTPDEVKASIDRLVEDLQSGAVVLPGN